LSGPLTLADGALIFDAALNVRDLDAQYNISIPEDPAYATVGGFVLDQLGFIPKGGERFEYGNFRFSVVEMDGKTRRSSQEFSAFEVPPLRMRLSDTQIATRPSKDSKPASVRS